MSEQYSKKLKENFLQPKNMGEVENANAKARVGNPTCGDIMEMTLAVDKDKVIRNIKFKTFGCAAAIATSSMVTQMAKGMTLEKAKNISMDDVAKKLDGLPKIKMHCSQMAIKTLRKAIEDYENNN